jgi:pSer/pThr/pTyr-binding forkhead associated (FHA) protein
VLYDLGSTNGTIVNGKRTQKQTLFDGDEIVIGRSVFVFKEVRK